MPLPRISSQPVRLQTGQPVAVAEHAADEHFGARLGVREEARTEQHLRAVLEQLVQERRERALQVRHRDALADDEPFDLLEHRRVRQVEVVAAVDLARAR